MAFKKALLGNTSSIQDLIFLGKLSLSGLNSMLVTPVVNQVPFNPSFKHVCGHRRDGNPLNTISVRSNNPKSLTALVKSTAAIPNPCTKMQV